MKLIHAGFEILDQVDGEAILEKLELIGRVCHKSEDLIEPESAQPFIKKMGY